ncbi:MAG: MGMT family protein [Trichlorobacter sp.]
MIYRSLFHTKLGIGQVVATDTGICRIDVPPLGECDAKGATSAVSRQAADQLERFFKGEPIRFDLSWDITGLTLFQQQVLRLTALIPYGHVVTYGYLAQQIGLPGAARAVGGVMAANPLPIVIPCHRVVAASGKLTGYSGAGGIAMKRYLLELEGVDFRGERVN